MRAYGNYVCAFPQLPAGYFFAFCGVCVSFGVRHQDGAISNVLYTIGACVGPLAVFFGLLGLLPSDNWLLPRIGPCLSTFAGACLALLYVLQVMHFLQRLECSWYRKQVPCWYLRVFAALRLFDLIPTFYLIVKIPWSACRDPANVLLSNLWRCFGYFFLCPGINNIPKLILGLVVGIKFLEEWVPLLIIVVFQISLGSLMILGVNFRRRVQSWFMSRGGQTVTAAGIAELLGGRSVPEVLEIARKSFLSVSADEITIEAMKNNIVCSEVLSRVCRKSKLGFVDAFLSHSWHDDPRAKWTALQRFRMDFRAKHGREPTIWMDTFCIDQTNVENSFVALPVYLSGCQKLVILCGETYLQRLWCLIEIFIFLEMGGQQDDLEVYALGHADDLHSSIRNFKVASARCFDPKDEARLMSVLKINEGSIEFIVRDAVRSQIEKHAIWSVDDKLVRTRKQVGHIRSVDDDEEEQATLLKQVVPLAPPPVWLPRLGAGQCNIVPEMWALTVHQLLSFVAACKETESWEVLTSFKDNIDVYDVCTHFVKPWSVGTGNSVALLMNPVPCRTQLMVSHAWGENVEECGQAISLFCCQHQLPNTTYIFFCTFSMYQGGDGHIDGLSIEEQIGLDPFKAVIRIQPEFGMIIVHTTTADVYTRMWCVHEVDEALAAAVNVRGAMSSAFMQKYSSRQIADTLLDLRTEAARCTSKTDEDSIRQAIVAKGGFARLDRVILKFRRDMFTTAGIVREVRRQLTP